MGILRHMHPGVGGIPKFSSKVVGQPGNPLRTVPYSRRSAAKEEGGGLYHGALRTDLNRLRLSKQWSCCESRDSSGRLRDSTGAPFLPWSEHCLTQFKPALVSFFSVVVVVVHIIISFYIFIKKWSVGDPYGRRR